MCLQDPVDLWEQSEGAHLPIESTPIGTDFINLVNVHSPV